MVTCKIKLKQNNHKTMFCFNEIVLFCFCFSALQCNLGQLSEHFVPFCPALINDDDDNAVENGTTLKFATPLKV